jgi:LacI family transcriptional regulator
MARKLPHIAVCIDKSRSYGRGVLRGIAAYVASHEPWSIYLDPHAAGSYADAWLQDWNGDGILAYIEKTGLARRLKQSGIPTVEVFGDRQDLGLPQVGNDDFSIGKMAAEHLLQRRFGYFAFSGYPGEFWVRERLRGFAATLQTSKFKVASFFCPRHHSSLSSWERTQEQLCDWLQQLKFPVGLMACSDRHAHRILDACRRVGLRVPEDVAVIGVDNDEEICMISTPSLSSVIDDAERVGYEAARLLDQLMSGKSPSPKNQVVHIAPIGVAVRRSTEILVTADALMGEVMRFMQQEAGNGIKVNNVLKKFGISRAAFYQRFQKAYNRSPHEELLRIRLEKVKQLLRQTELSLEQIADRCGFDHPEYLSVVFRRENQLTPGQYRKQHLLTRPAYD